jgi:hypothetical protein
MEAGEEKSGSGEEEEETTVHQGVLLRMALGERDGSTGCGRVLVSCGPTDKLKEKHG